MHRLVRPQLHHVPNCPHGSIGPAELNDSGTPPTVLDFSVNTNPLGPPPAVLRALSTVNISRYPDPDATELRTKLAERLDSPVGWVMAGNGSAELIWLIALAFLEPDDRVLIIGPTFGEYERACHVMGAEVVHYRADAESRFFPDGRAVREMAARLQPKLIFLCNPNNPTGVLLEPDWLQSLMSEDSLLVLDEAYAAFAPSHASHTMDVEQANIILLRSLTKDFALTGLRLGYAVADPSVIQALETVRPPWSVNAMAQAAGLACLDDPDHLPRSLHAVDEAKQYLFTALSELGLHPVPSSANFFLVEVGNAPTFRQSLLRRGLCVRDCSSFGLPTYVRIGIRTVAECKMLVQGVSEVLGRGSGVTGQEAGDGIACPTTAGAVLDTEERTVE